jgi:hypothetical protein
LQRDLEDRKAEQSRILEMVKIGDPDKAAANLDFLLKSGLISDPSRASKLESFLKTRQPGTGPYLPSPVASTGNEPVDEAVFVTKLPAESPLNNAVGAVGQLKAVNSTEILAQPDRRSCGSMIAGEVSHHIKLNFWRNQMTRTTRC